MPRTLQAGKLPPHLAWAMHATANSILLADDGRTREEREKDSDTFCLGFLRFIQTDAGAYLDRQLLRAFIYRDEYGML